MMADTLLRKELRLNKIESGLILIILLKIQQKAIYERYNTEETEYVSIYEVL